MTGASLTEPENILFYSKFLYGTEDHSYWWISLEAYFNPVILGVDGQIDILLRCMNSFGRI